MDLDANLPELLKDPEFMESFLEDIRATYSQLKQALDHEVPNKTAGRESMSEVMRAMHMLRGAAGAVQFSLGFHFAETIHRLAEVGLSFSDNLRKEFLSIFNFCKEAESLLGQIIKGLVEQDISDLFEKYLLLKEEIDFKYGDYFYDKENDIGNEIGNDNETDEITEIDIDDFENFTASVIQEVDQKKQQTEAPIVAVESSQPVTIGADSPEDQKSDNSLKSQRLKLYQLNIDTVANWDVLKYFFQEMDENLTALESALLLLEKGKSIKLATTEVFRVTHSTKGAANSMGMYRIAKIMHELEFVFEQKRDRKISPQKADYSRLLQSVDLAREILREVEEGKPQSGLPERIDDYFQALFELTDSTNKTQVKQARPKAKKAVKKSNAKKQTKAAPLSLDPVEKVPLSAHSNTFRIDASKVDTLMNTVGELIISRSRMSKRVNELVSLCAELDKSRLRMKSTLNSFADHFEYTKESTAISSPKLNGGIATKGTIESSFTSMEFDRYDAFNILSRKITEIGDDAEVAMQDIRAEGGALERDSLSLGVHINQLQEEIASTRLAPIHVLFKRLQRSVRDAAIKLDKTVIFESIGDELLIDKSILDDLFVPMLHIARNSVAHAFDSTTQKNRIQISATQEGGRILLSVKDNGKGLDYEKIYKVANEKGMVAERPDNSDELLNFIFNPGFSTSAIADEVSGRGIGLDVVKDAVQRMGGTISVSSERSHGSTFTLHLPLTLAVDKAMYFDVGDQNYAVLMASVEHVYFSSELEFAHLSGREVVQFDEETIPVVDLIEAFGSTTEDTPNRTTIVICNHLGTKVALRVSRVSYHEDIVMKNLGSLFAEHRFFGAATISADGEIIPIVDISRICDLIIGTAVVISQPLSIDSAVVRIPQILVVDDSISVRKICEGYLTQSGHSVDTANDGIEALNCVKSKKYDVIISDLEMPRLNGLELIAELKDHDETASIPVVVVTSRSAEKHLNSVLQAGASACLSKPFTREAILEAVHKYV